MLIVTFMNGMISDGREGENKRSSCNVFAEDKEDRMKITKLNDRGGGCQLVYEFTRGDVIGGKSDDSAIIGGD